MTHDILTDWPAPLQWSMS